MAQYSPASPPVAEVPPINSRSQACYFAGQAAGKALKGTLPELGQEPLNTHVLNDLVGELAAQGGEVAVIAFLEQLDRPGA